MLSDVVEPSLVCYCCFCQMFTTNHDRSLSAGILPVSASESPLDSITLPRKIEIEDPPGLNPKTLVDRYFEDCEDFAPAALASAMRSALGQTLGQKADFLQDRLARFQTHKDHLLFGDSATLREDSTLVSAHCEASSHYLVALVFKKLLQDNGTAVTLPQGEALEVSAKRVVSALIHMDKLDGEYGYIALRAAVDPSTGELKVKDSKTKSNSYSQILFAYVLAAEVFGPEVKALITDHVDAMVGRLLGDGFKLIHPNGKKVSDTSPSKFGLFNSSRYLDALIAIEAGIHLGTQDLSEGGRISSLMKMRERFIGTYEKPDRLVKFIFNKMLHTNVASQQFPTVSSSVLNVMKLSALMLMTRQNQDAQKYYGDILGSLWGKLEHQHNPLVDLLCLITSQPNHSGRQEYLERAAASLQTFPTDLLNIGRYDLSEFCLEGKVIREKLIRKYPRSDSVLPVFARPWSPFIWKMDSRTCHFSHPDQEPRNTANGLDYLMTYYMLHCAARNLSL